MGCGASSSRNGAYTIDSRRPLAGAGLLSSVKTYAESAVFAAPLSVWIDDNCLAFTEEYISDPGMELAIRKAHEGYIQFSDNLLYAHLVKVAPSLRPDPLTAFYRTCRDHATAPEVASPVIRQILAMSDVNCFQMMMVTRNAELDIQAMGEKLEGYELSGTSAVDRVDDDEQLRQALELSLLESASGAGLDRGSQEGRGSMLLSANLDGCNGRGVRGGREDEREREEEDEEDRDLQHALAVSGDIETREETLRRQRRDLEQAQLEAALAQSLASSAASEVEHVRAKTRAQEKARTRQRNSDEQKAEARLAEQRVAMARELDALRMQAAEETAQQQAVWEATLAAEKDAMFEAEQKKRAELEHTLAAVQREMQERMEVCSPCRTYCAHTRSSGICRNGCAINI